jgi:hypothetical protein
MASILLDSGALIAIDRGDRRVGAALAVAARAGVDVVTSSACVAETWREPARQARLTRALRGVVEQPLDPPAARQCGVLLGRARARDIADAAIATLARPGDVVLSSDPDDLRHLIGAAGTTVRVERI